MNREEIWNEATLAERKRCADAVASCAIPHYMALGTVNLALSKIDPDYPMVEFKPIEFTSVRLHFAE